MCGWTTQTNLLGKCNTGRVAMILLQRSKTTTCGEREFESYPYIDVVCFRGDMLSVGVLIDRVILRLQHLHVERAG